MPFCPFMFAQKKANEIFADFRIFLNSTINAPYLYSDINCYTEIFAVFCIYISSRSLVIFSRPETFPTDKFVCRSIGPSTFTTLVYTLPHVYLLELQCLFPLFPQNEPCTISLQAASSLGHGFALASSLPNLAL